MTGVVSILLLCLTTVQPTFISRCSKVGYVLLGQSYRTFTSNNYPSCLAACRADVKCVSLNFNLQNRVCDLNKHSKQDRPSSVVQNPSSIYFQARIDYMHAFGMRSGAIRDHQINASSFYANGWEPWRGRLNHKGGASCWGPRLNRSGEYLEVDLGRVKIVKMIATQGREVAAEWVTAYEVAHSQDGAQWMKVITHNGNVKKFAGNRNQTTSRYNSLPVAIQARYVRIYPTGFQGWMSLRAEFYGYDL